MHGLNHHAYAVALANTRVGETNYHSFNDFSGEWGNNYKTLANPKIAASDTRVMHVRAELPTTAWNIHGDIRDNR